MQGKEIFDKIMEWLYNDFIQARATEKAKWYDNGLIGTLARAIGIEEETLTFIMNKFLDEKLWTNIPCITHSTYELTGLGEFIMSRNRGFKQKCHVYTLHRDLIGEEIDKELKLLK